MKKIKFQIGLKTVFMMLVLLFMVLTVQSQNSDGNQPAQKGLGSKLKQIKLPEGIGPRIPGMKKVFSEETEQEEPESENSDEDDPDEKRFDEDEEDIDKMMDKMIRQLGHDPAKVQQMMNEDAPASDPRAIAVADQKVISSIKPTPRNESELLSYLKGFDSGSDQALSPEARKKAIPYLNKGQQTKEAGYMLWLTGQQEAAAYLMLKAAIADPKDELLLSNLGSVITMAGYAEKSIPILEYLKTKNPKSSIVNNNLGQAWLSLGNIEKAKPLLEEAVGIYDQHPEANRSLARIALKEGNKEKAKKYLENAQKGGFSQETFYELMDIHGIRTPSMVESIRLNHKHNYGEIAVNKRFAMPSVPSTFQQASDREQEIEDFFHGIELTLENLNSKIPDSAEYVALGQEKIAMQMNANIKKMSNLDDIKKQYQLASKIWNPFKAQAQEMLNSEIDDSYAPSYNKRMNQLKVSREMKIRQLEESLSADYRQIQELQKELSKYEAGENENSKVQALERQICAQTRKLEEMRFSQLSAINNAFVMEMESLAFKQLQENIYWYSLYFLPQDPTLFNYRLYGSYLSTLNSLKNVYPFPVPAPYIGNGCERKSLEPVFPNGEMSKWEDTHCLTYWDLDLHYIKTKFTCKELTVTAKVEGVEVGYGEKYDPSTIMTIEHSITFGGKIGKETETVGKNLAVSVGAGLVTTVKVDGNFNLKDIIVKATAGAELGIKVPKSRDPNDSGLDIRQAASIGVSTGAELSILSGFRGTVPKVTTVGNIFNR